jgi:hypothetical protein
MMKFARSLFLALCFGLLLAVSGGRQAQAGTDLVVTCANEGPCSVNPAATPLFYELNIYPGVTRTQQLTIINNDANDTCDLGLTVPAYRKPLGQVPNLQNAMFAAIVSGGTNYFGSVSGGAAVTGTTYNNLYTNHAGFPLSLGSLAPGASRVYTWYATFDPAAGNEYENVETVFDFRVAISCSGGSSGSSGSGSGSGSSGSSGSSGGTSPASPPVCNDGVPSSAPALSVTSVGTNTVSLSWTPVTPVTHYALVFTRTSDGAQYGSSNIGNVTSFTVQNLSGGANYTFEVFGVNGCAPGPRSSTVNTGNVPGPFIASRPIGGGQVLGTTTASPSPSPSASPAPSASPTVLGTTDEAVCKQYNQYIPWILLVVQLVFILGVEYYLRRDSGWTKHYLAVAITLASIVIFYLIRECDCYGKQGFSILVWLCTWYWLVSLLETGFLKLLSYAFIEEIEETETTKKPASDQATDSSKE